MSSTTETKRIKDPDFQKKESYWLRLLRNANWSKLIGSKLKELRKREQNRQKICREKKKKRTTRKGKELSLKSKYTKHFNRFSTKTKSSCWMPGKSFWAKTWRWNWKKTQTLKQLRNIKKSLNSSFKKTYIQHLVWQTLSQFMKMGRKSSCTSTTWKCIYMNSTHFC